MWWKEKWLFKDWWCLYKGWYKWEWMRGVFVGWAASCSICCYISMKCPQSNSVTIVVWYIDYAWWFWACILVLWTWSDCMAIQVLGTSSMSAEAEYMHLDLLSYVLICSCLDWFKRCEHVCVCAVCNRCVFGVYSILWCIGDFTRFYNRLELFSLQSSLMGGRSWGLTGGWAKGQVAILPLVLLICQPLYSLVLWPAIQ